MLRSTKSCRLLPSRQLNLRLTFRPVRLRRVSAPGWRVSAPVWRVSPPGWRSRMHTWPAWSSPCWVSCWSAVTGISRGLWRATAPWRHRQSLQRTRFSSREGCSREGCRREGCRSKRSAAALELLGERVLHPHVPEPAAVLEVFRIQDVGSRGEGCLHDESVPERQRFRTLGLSRQEHQLRCDGDDGKGGKCLQSSDCLLWIQRCGQLLRGYGKELL